MDASRAGLRRSKIDAVRQPPRRGTLAPENRDVGRVEWRIPSEARLGLPGNRQLLTVRERAIRPPEGRNRACDVCRFTFPGHGCSEPGLVDGRVQEVAPRIDPDAQPRFFARPKASLPGMHLCAAGSTTRPAPPTNSTCERIPALTGRILPRASDLWVQARSTTSSNCRRCAFRRGSRTRESDSIEPPPQYHFSRTWRRARVLKESW